MKNEDRINVKYLGKYGFDDDILNAMIKFDIMFPVDVRINEKGTKDYFVKKSDVVLLLNRFLANSMKMYETFNQIEEKTEAVLKEAETVELK